jgi:hypothetical protein
MSVKIVTGVVRLSYLHYPEPRADKKGNLKYGSMLIIKKNDDYTMDLLNKAFEEEFTANAAMLKPKTLKKCKEFIHDGDEERPDDPNCEGCFYINVSSNSKPEIIGKNGKPIEDPDEIYSGMYARVSVVVKAYENESKGITAYLNNIMKWKDGDRLDGSTDAYTDFKEFVSNDFEGGDDDDDDLL